MAPPRGQTIVRIPHVNGGHAHVRGTRVLVHDIVFRFMQGAGSHELAELYGVPTSTIDAALRYEIKRLDQARIGEKRRARKG